MASENGDHSLVYMLLQAGADPTIEDNLGWRAKDHAAFRGWLPIAKELSQLAADQLEKGDEVNSIEQQRRHNVKSELSINFAERLKRQQSADECEVFVNLGALDTYKPVLGVDLGPYVKPNPYTPQREADYTVEVRAINGDQTRHLVQLPVLEDRANKPWRFVTKDPEDFKLAFTIYHSTTSGQKGDSPIGSAVALLRSLKQGFGPARESLIRNFTIPILHNDNLEFIGTITFYCLIVTPFPHPDPRKVIQRELPCLGEDGLPIIGHRGMGQNDPGGRHLQLGENTIESFKSAKASGASYVEFDVQLTKDDVPIIYHDFLMSETGIDAPLHYLDLEQFMFISQAQSPVGDPSSQAERNYLGRNSDSSIVAKYRQRSYSLDTHEQAKARGLIEHMQHTFEYKLNEHKGFDSYKGNIRSKYIQASFATLEELFTKLPESIRFDIEISKLFLGKMVSCKGIRLILFVSLYRVSHAFRSPRLENGDLRGRSQSFSGQCSRSGVPARQRPHHVLFLLQPRGVHSTLAKTTCVSSLLPDRIRPYSVIGRTCRQPSGSHMVRQELASGRCHLQISTTGSESAAHWMCTGCWACVYLVGRIER
ncbi:MAG: hypothetical protein Q9208_002233 [Pyrenodesmia sp. 3 TL-2023]